MSCEPKLDGGNSGARVGGFVVADGGGGGKENAGFCGAAVVDVAGAGDWKFEKSPKSSSSSPISKFAVCAMAGRDDPGGGASSGATTPGFMGAFTIIGV